MQDLISRQAAIDAIEKLILPQTKGETMAEEINRVAWRCAINCAEEMIGHLPTIDPLKHGRWIPVSERLPEENSDILVTYVEKDEKRIVPVNYGCGTWFDCLFNKVLDLGGVLAWMPLPEPYKEGEKE